MGIFASDVAIVFFAGSCRANSNPYAELSQSALLADSLFYT